MRTSQRRTIVGLSVIATLATMLLAVGAACAAPTKELLHDQFGWKVNGNESNFCITPECKAFGGESSEKAGGFKNAKGVAIAPDGNIYVAEPGNQRVQELTPNGEFVLMIGWNVNKTVGTAHPTICLKAEESECQKGAGSTEPGGFRGPQAVAVDPGSGNIYVSEAGGDRVDEFTESGQFVLTIGKKVNVNTGGNLCTAAEAGYKCTSGERGGSEHSAFNLAGKGNELAAGGPKDLLYVGDEHRVEEFKPDGTWVHDLTLTAISSAPESRVRALTVDQASGSVYVGYYILSATEHENVIHKFNAVTDNEEAEFTLTARQPSSIVEIEGMALDPALSGTLGVVEHEGTERYGSIVNMTDDERVTQFTVGGLSGTLEVPSLAFNSAGELYGGFLGRNEVVGYEPKLVGELLAGALTCKQESETETLVTVECALNGEVNPENVAQTKVWFQWGPTSALGEVAPSLPIAIATGSTPVPVPPPPAPAGVPVNGLRPNETIYYRLAGEDEYVKAPESPLTSAEALKTTASVPPRVVGEPSASFVKTTSAVLSGELNPENASSEYSFEYEACREPGVCETPRKTGALQAATYGKIGATLEATGLQPDTTYRYRLAVVNYKGESAVNETGGMPLPEGEFKTAPTPKVEAATDLPSTITATGVTVAGEVNPDGEPGVYTFELGVYNGVSTVYSTVGQGSTGAEVGMTPVSLAVTGLQPGTTYGYRVRIESAYGKAEGAPVTFSTSGQPASPLGPALVPQLALPKISFPTVPKAAKPCRHGYKRNKRGRCVKIKNKAKGHGKGKKARRKARG